MRVVLPLLLVACVPLAGAGTVTVLDSAGDVGAHASLAIGSDGLGLIAYYDATNGDLKLAHCANAACTAATLSRIDSAGDVGRFAGLAIGADGRGIVSYFDATSAALKVAHCDDVACTTATTATVASAVVRGRTAMAIGSDGLPFIAFAASPPGTTEPARLRTLHCANAACTSGQAQPHAFLGGQVDLDTAVAIGGDGLPLIAYVPADDVPGPPEIGLLHCTDVACTSAQPAKQSPAPSRVALVGAGRVRSPALATAPDGLARIAFGLTFGGPGVVVNETAFLRCADAACGQAERESFSALQAAPSLALVSGGLALVTWARSDQLTLARCTDAQCHGFSQTCAPVVAATPSLALGGDAVPLAAVYARPTGDLAVAHGIDDPCGDPTFGPASAQLTVQEGDSGSQTLSVLFNLSGPVAAAATVDYATRNGSATAGTDYLAAAGTLTYGIFTVQVPLSVHGDTVDEPDETFYLDFANPANVVLGGSQVAVTIVDDDDATITADDCASVEGNSGTNTCAIAVRLSAPSPVPVTVDFATANGTATAGTDYIAQSGTLTFSPGTVARGVTVSIVGDVAVELDETFFVNLSNPSSGAVIGDGSGTGTIVDDDAPSLSSLELTHGSRVTADLAAPGPLADLYRLAQGPYSSWEIVVDEVSGDIAPALILERLAEDNSTVLQTGAAVGMGPARTMRWQRREATAEARQHIRVRSGSCTTDCGADDRYRLRAYETTGSIPRFNNSASQVTILVLQNATDQPIQAFADFWNASGVRVHTETLSLAPRAVALVNTATVGALAGTSGSITITHDGRYGGVAGKSVALEPSTGFSFDSPMLVKPR